MQERDQLRITIDKLNKLDESDLSFITHEEARNYVQVLQEKSLAAKRKHFLQEVPSSSQELKEILENLIQLNRAAERRVGEGGCGTDVSRADTGV